MKNTILFSTALISLLTFYSCTKSDGTSTGNPLVAVTMTGSTANAIASIQSQNKYPWLLNQAYALPPPSNMLDLVSSTVTVSQFWFNISEIELKSNETDDS